MRLTYAQSQAVIVNGQVLVSGQIPADAQGTLIEGSIADKTEASCKNIIAILEEAGSDISRVFKVRLSSSPCSPRPMADHCM